MGAASADAWLHPTVYYRGAPCLLNLLLARHGQAWFGTQTLQARVRIECGAVCCA
jgi:hypothetical protein